MRLVLYCMGSKDHYRIASIHIFHTLNWGKGGSKIQINRIMKSPHPLIMMDDQKLIKIRLSIYFLNVDLDGAAKITLCIMNNS